MRTKLLFYFLGACIFLLAACGSSPAEIATQTAVAQTTVAASWTDTPAPTDTATFTPVPTATETFTPTPDPCLPENLSDAIDAYNKIFTQFQNVSIIAANVPRAQLRDEIKKLQDLRQAAQDQVTPPCLEALRDHQLKHMNFVIDALTAFADEKGQMTVNSLIGNARTEHDEYMKEMMRLLDITPTPWVR